MRNFLWNVYVDGCGTLTGRNGKNSPTARKGWGPGVAAATARLRLKLQRFGVQG